MSLKDVEIEIILDLFLKKKKINLNNCFYLKKSHSSKLFNSYLIICNYCFKNFHLNYSWQFNFILSIRILRNNFLYGLIKWLLINRSPAYGNIFALECWMRIIYAQMRDSLTLWRFSWIRWPMWWPSGPVMSSWQPSYIGIATTSRRIWLEPVDQYPVR